MSIVTLVSPFSTYRGRTGAVGGQVLYPIGQRTIGRGFVQPANPDTSAQIQARALFSQASQAYSSLSAAEVAAWQTLADALPRTDPDGLPYSPTAKGTYVSVNFWRLADAQAISDVAPAAVTQLAATAVTGVDLNTGGATTDFTWTHANDDGRFVLLGSAALPGEVRRARRTDIRVISRPFAPAINAESASPQTATINTTQIVFPWVSGDRVAVRILSLSDAYLPGQAFQQEFDVTTS